MPVPSDIFALSQTTNNNFPGGTESPNTADDYFRFYASCLAVLRDGQGFAAPVQLASATTTGIGAQVSQFVEITGTTTITSFGTTYRGPRFLRFTGALTLTHNATTLNLPGAANITTAAGDACVAVPNFAGNGWNVVQYQRVDNVDFLNSTRIDVASAGTVNLTSSAPKTRNINVTGTTTITAFTVAIGQLYFVRFNASLTLTNNANVITNTGANIVTQAGDTCLLRATAANVVEVLSYTPAVLMQQTNRSMVRLITANGFGSTNTAIRRFTTVNANQGTDITYADSATLGASFTINAAGVYAISYNDNFGSASPLGISLNTTQPTTVITLITAADRLIAASASSASDPMPASWTGYLAAGSVIRAHAQAVAGGVADRSSFTIVRIA